MKVLGCDPGKHLGWAVLDLSGTRPRYIDGGVYEHPFVGLADGGLGVAAGLWLALYGLASERAELVAVESVQAMYGRARFGIAMANAIQDATRVEERLLAAARAQGIPTATCTAAEARRGIAGAYRAKDATVKEAVLRLIDGLPKRTSAHMRDAAVAAMFCGRRAKLQAMRKPA